MVFNGFASIYSFLMYKKRILLCFFPPSCRSIRNTSLTSLVLLEGLLCVLGMYCELLLAAF